jgi:hypothetical protein
MKSVNFLDPSGPLQDCNGTALPVVEKVERGIVLVMVVSAERGKK